MKLEALLDWYANMSPETLYAVCDFYHEQARFRDPFNEVEGNTAIAAIFRHMFATTKEPEFEIGEVLRGESGVWVSWRFRCRIRGKSLSVEGVTQLEFCADGRIINHRDFWDSAELLAQLPMIGTMVRYVQEKLQAPQPSLT